MKWNEDSWHVIWCVLHFTLWWYSKHRLEGFGVTYLIKLSFFPIRLTQEQKACIVLTLAHTDNVLLRHVVLWLRLHLSSLTLYLFNGGAGGGGTGQRGLRGTPAPHSCPVCRDHWLKPSTDLNQCTLCTVLRISAHYRVYIKIH